MGAPPRRLITEWEAGAPLMGIFVLISSPLMYIEYMDQRTGKYEDVDTPDIYVSEDKEHGIVSQTAQAFLDCDAGYVNENIVSPRQGILVLFHRSLQELKNWKNGDEFVCGILSKISEFAEKKSENSISVFFYSFL